MNPSRKQVYALKKKHSTITLNIGLLEKNVNKVLADRPEMARLILAKIRALVAPMNEVKALCQFATALYIGHYLVKYPNVDQDSNKARAVVFYPLLVGHDGTKTYHQQLLRLVLGGGIKRGSSKEEAEKAFSLWQNSRPQPELGELQKKYNIKSCTRTSQMLSSTMDTEAAFHLQGSFPFVLAKVIIL
jgi:hypothetical protein